MDYDALEILWNTESDNLGLYCGRAGCNALICDVEAGDTLGVLARTGADHECETEA